MHKNKTGFTLIELIVVVLIVATLSALAIPRYIKAREYAIVKEALINLRLIQVAEKMYYLENTNKYYPQSAQTITIVGTINTDLHLSLNETYWDYAIESSDGSSFTATAERIAGGPYAGCQYSILPDSDPSQSSGSCP